LISDEEIELNDDLEKDLGFDSLDLVEIYSYIESEFDINISDEEEESIKTVGDLIQVIDSLK
jgi:acyl carrier protein